MHKYSFIFAALIFFSFAPMVSAASLTVLDYSACSHYLGLVSCNQQTEVCVTKPDTGLPGCELKTNVTNYVNYTTRYPDLTTCNQSSNCPYACTRNSLDIPTVYFCSNTPPTSSTVTPTPTPVQTQPPAGNTIPAGTNTTRTQPQGTNNTGTAVTLINPLNSGSCDPNSNCLLAFLNKILDFVINIGAIVVILMLVYVGFLFVAAQGEPGKLTTARQALLWTVIGALILLGAKVISAGIAATVQALSTGG